MRKIKITLCMINYYEDYLCAKVVSQVYPFVDEILIGDGSRGKDMLREFMKGCSKVKIIEVPFEARRGKKFDLSAWCNYIQTHATGDWILWQDPDELFPYRILENLRTWIKELKVEAIGFLRCDPDDFKRKSWNKEEPKIRLWKNNGIIKWKGIAHHYPVGYSSYQIIAERYWHDSFVVSYHHLVYKFKDKEKQGTLTERNRKRFVDPNRNSYPEEEREKVLRSRE